MPQNLYQKSNVAEISQLRRETYLHKNMSKIPELTTGSFSYYNLDKTQKYPLPHKSHFLPRNSKMSNNMVERKSPGVDHGEWAIH